MYKQQEAGYFKPLEFGKTTVYKRKEPVYYIEDAEVTEKEFEKSKEVKTVKYLEKQLTYREYYMELEEENKQLKQQIDAQSKISDFQEDLIVELAMQLY